jgi:hypothetical protein
VVIIFRCQECGAFLQFISGNKALLKGQFFKSGQPALVVDAGLASLLCTRDVLNEEVVELAPLVASGVGQCHGNPKRPALPGIFKDQFTVIPGQR